MDLEQHISKQSGGELLTRVILCAAGAAVLLAAAEALPPQKLPLWDKYRPWVAKNRTQAIAILAVILYGVSLLLLPAEPKETTEEGYSPCP